jgi:SAM-dependent methyltransferase
MKEDVFQRYSAYYDLLYRDKDYAAEAEYILRTLHDAVPTARKLLEFGSGTGRHGRFFADRGFEVFGVERSETMAAVARDTARATKFARGGKFDCVQGDVRTVALQETFDAVLALFHVVSYQVSNHDLSETFANAARHLQAGGVFVFDVWHGPAVLGERPAVRVKRVEDEHVLLTRIAEPELDLNASVVTVRYSMLAEAKTGAKLEKFGEEHRMRYLFPTEIDLLAKQSGFAVEKCEEFLTSKPASGRTWGVAYVLRKTV